jgi:hypothetical protein
VAKISTVDESTTADQHNTGKELLDEKLQLSKPSNDDAITGNDAATTNPTLINLLLEDDYTLERVALALMLSFLLSQPHREKIVGNKSLVSALIAIVQTESLVDLHYEAIELIAAFTSYALDSPSLLVELFTSVIERQTRLFQESSDNDRSTSSKQMTALAVAGMQNLFCAAINDDLKVKGIVASSNLFSFLVDSLYVGPKSRRLALTLADGLLFSNLTSLFLVANNETRDIGGKLLSTRHISSMLRFIMMASGAVSSIVLAVRNEGSDYFDAALEFCLIELSKVTNETSQMQMEKSLVSLIEEIEPSSGAFIHCLEQLSSEKLFGGASRVIAMKVLSALRCFMGSIII